MGTLSDEYEGLTDSVKNDNIEEYLKNNYPSLTDDQAHRLAFEVSLVSLTSRFLGRKDNVEKLRSKLIKLANQFK